MSDLATSPEVLTLSEDQIVVTRGVTGEAVNYVSFGNGNNGDVELIGEQGLSFSPNRATFSFEDLVAPESTESFFSDYWKQSLYLA